MNIAIVLDPLDGIDPAGDSSVALIEAAQAQGHTSYVAEARELAIRGGEACAPLRRIRLAEGRTDGPRWLAPDPWYQLDPEAGLVAFGAMDAVLFRTDPPVDRRYLWATWLLDAIDASRTIMVNDPRGLRHANEKLFALRFPDLIPPTLVSSDARLIRRFVDEHGTAVAKPIDGHAGRGVLRLSVDDPNVASIVEVMTGRGSQPIVVQAWVGAATSGNRRLLLYDGVILGSVDRLPQDADFRTGNPCRSAAITARDEEIVARLRPHLRDLGLRLVGLDVIGEHLIEVNVTSPGGIRQAEGLGLAGISREIVQRIEAEWRRRQ
jgi:glutathione synthase